MSVIRVLGIDFAIQRWSDVGTACLTLDSDKQCWLDAELGCIDWLCRDSVTIDRMVQRVLQFVEANHVQVIAIDGPHAWRENDASHTRAGRLSEFELRCQSKTGRFGIVYPSTMLRWTQQCIDLFSRLIKSGWQLANSAEFDSGEFADSMKAGHRNVLECLPTATWLQNDLAPLPSKQSMRKQSLTLETFSNALSNAFHLPSVRGPLTHDHLQALVAAIVAGAIAGGPAQALAHGKAAYSENSGVLEGESHPVEGLIWTATSDGLSQSTESL